PRFIAVPERLVALWAGFLAFLLAFFGRLAVSGDPASAIFTACVACLVGCYIGRGVTSYLNSSLEPDFDETDEIDEPEASPAPASRSASRA
ncbi:MAG: hypothetical protein ACLFU2_13765, partial [Opitutales bacterium]